MRLKIVSLILVLRLLAVQCAAASVQAPGSAVAGGKLAHRSIRHRMLYRHYRGDNSDSYNDDSYNNEGNNDTPAADARNSSATPLPSKAAALASYASTAPLPADASSRAGGSVNSTPAGTDQAVPPSIKFTSMSPARIQATDSPVVLLEIGSQGNSGVIGNITQLASAVQQLVSGYTPPSNNATNQQPAQHASPLPPLTSAVPPGVAANSSGSPVPSSAAGPLSPPPAPPSPAAAAKAPSSRAVKRRRSMWRRAVDCSPPLNSSYSLGLGGYWYVHEAQDVPLGLPIRAVPDVQLHRFVMCAWSVSNFSSNTMLSEEVMNRVQGM